MHLQIVRPDAVTPPELDRWLADGWYRVGQVLMTCRLLLNDTGLRSAVWTRVPLERHRFKRSHRKLLSKAHRTFRVVVGPAIADSAHEALYRRYLGVARGERPSSLRDFALGDAQQDLFETREIALWDGDRLAGFSWFDIGVDSMQSLIGVYDPDWSRLSLGFTSLLLELEEAHRLGLTYHYAGYVLPGDPSMDYKLRPQPIEFLDPKQSAWRPWSEVSLEELPAEVIRSRLQAAAAALQARGVPCERLTYDAYRLQAPGTRLLAEPMALAISPFGRTGPVELVTWHLDEGCYVLLRGVRAVARHQAAPGARPHSIAVWVIQEEMARADDVATLLVSLL